MLNIKKIYFYLVSFISLLVVLVSLHGVLNVSLRYFVFKTAPQFTYQPPFVTNFLPVPQPSVVYNPNEPFIRNQELESKKMVDQIMLNPQTDADIKTALKNWSDSYDAWKLEQLNHQKAIVDSIVSSLVSLLLFLPIFIFHIKEALKRDEVVEDYDDFDEMWEDDCCDDGCDCGKESCGCGGNCGCGNHADGEKKSGEGAVEEESCACGKIGSCHCGKH